MAGADSSREFLGWFDTHRNEVCYFQRAGDGVMRCQPDGVFPNTYFMDAGCTQRVVDVYKGICATPPLYSKVAMPSDPATCTYGGHSIHFVGAQLGAQSVYVLGNPADCTEVPAAEWMLYHDMYVLGAEIAPTEFVAGEYMIE